MRKRLLAMGMVALCAMPLAAAAQVGPPRPGPRCLPGAYDGGQTEIAAELKLGADHRFSYALSYGALDEMAEGNWEADGAGQVLLTSDATTPPRFLLLGEGPAAPGELRIALDVPSGISRQYFGAIVHFADGRSAIRRFEEDGLTLALSPQDKPVSVTMLLTVLELESEPLKLGNSSGGGEVHVRFEANDIGKVAFARTPLRIDQDDLLLERHERQIRFKHSPEGC